MSFEIRSSNDRPMVTRSQSLLKDGGGGGNLGYFNGRRKKQEEPKKSIFDDDYDELEFSKKEETPEPQKNVESESEPIDVLSEVKNLFKSFFN